MSNRILSSLLAGVLAATALGTAAGAEDIGAEIVQSVPPGVPVNAQVPPLHLSDSQRSRIAHVLLTRHEEVDLTLKANKSAASFEPKIGAALPKALKGDAFPPPLTAEIPVTKRYTYLKFKGQVLIVNPMSHKIADMFPEATN